MLIVQMAAKSKGRSRSPKKRTTKKKPSEPLLNQLGAFVMRYEVAGIVLILISVLTLLSLVTDSRGTVTSAWIQFLNNLVGVGIWGVPFVSGALGLWLIIYSIEQFDNLAWERPAGIGMILVAFITGASLSQSSTISTTISQTGADGGLIGNFIASSLRQGIGLGGSWAIVTLLMICGVVVFGDQFFREQAAILWEQYQDWRMNRHPGQPRMPEQQPLYTGGSQGGTLGDGVEATIRRGNLPTLDEIGRVPRWKKYVDLGNLFTKNRSTQHYPSSEGVVESPHSSPSMPAKQTGNASQSASAASKSQSPPPDKHGSSAKKEPLPARIIGGGSEWQPQQLPRLEAVLKSWDRVVDNDDVIRLQGTQIQETLALFGVPVSFEGVNQGPTVTQYLIRPGYEERVVKGEIKRTKVKVSKIAGLANDLALALAASSVRIEAPVPGTSYVGVEVPNRTTNFVGLRDLMESETFEEKNGKLKIALGEDVKGNAIVSDLARMPHLLIAGATGSGKSSCINSIIAALLCTHTTETLRMLMIDPKMVELSIYNQVPHLLSPVVTEVDKASAVLYWAVKEMERRYQLCSRANARDLERYNSYLKGRGEKPLPFIVIIVDEMADLMMAAPEEVEKHICRLAQMARAVGLHLIIATQRPSVDVITGLIKANFPSRIAFAVTSQTDSRVILDSPGAERLLGKGDMLFMGADGSKLERMQGTYVDDDEINNVVRYWKGVRVVEAETNQILEEEEPPTMAEETETEQELSSFEPRTSPSKAPKGRSRTSNKSSTQRSKSRQPTRPPTSTPSTGHLDLNRAESSDGIGGRTSYGAPEEHPSLFDEVEEMRTEESRDGLFDFAVELVMEEGRGSTSLLQRKLRIGYNRASRLVDQLEEAGILGPDQGGSQGRPVLVGSYSADDAQQLSSGPTPRVIGGDGVEHSHGSDGRRNQNGNSGDRNGGSDHEFWF
ncbi:MAG: DNA translocase FtsK 4TM domain-containing protein [Chloroflexota bacterium]